MRSLLVITLVVASASTTVAQQPLRPVEILHLEHLEAGPTVDIVSRLLGPDGICASHAATNSLLIIDDGAHIARIRDAVRRLEERAAAIRPRRARRR